MELSEKKEMIERLIKDAIVAIDSRQFEVAITCYNKAIEIDPNNIEAWIGKGNVLDNYEVEKGSFDRYEETLKCFKKVIEIDPNNTEAWNGMAGVYSSLKKYSEEDTCYNKAIEIDPTNIDAWLGKENYDEAIRCIDKLIAINPNDTEAWIGKGNILSLLEKDEEAIICYEKAIECYNKILTMDPKNVSIWLDKGNVCCNYEKYEEALKCYNRAIEINSTNIKSWYDKADLLKRLNRYENTLKCYDKIIEIGPKNTNVLYDKAQILNRLKRYNDELKCYDKIIEIDPKNTNAWFGMGHVFTKDLNKQESALKCYDKIIEIEPKNTNAWSYKGYALRDLDQFEEAIKCYDRIIEIDPNHPSAKRYKESSLKSIESRKKVNQIGKTTATRITTAITSKVINQPGDYYCCSLCAAWHRCTNNPSSIGNKHLSHLDETETNSQTPKYFFCSLCNKWHPGVITDHLRFRVPIHIDLTMEQTPSPLPSLEPSSTQPHNTKSNISINTTVAEIKDITDGSTKENTQSKRSRLIDSAPIKFDLKLFAEEEILLAKLSTINTYLFCWDEIPGKDTIKFLEFIKHFFLINWIETPKIQKKDDFTLIIHNDKDYLILSFNNDKTKALLEKDGGGSIEFIVKKENEKYNIYKTKISMVSQTHLFKDIAQIKYNLDKYVEAIEFWEKAIDISKNCPKKLNVSEKQYEYSYTNIEENIFKTYRKIIHIYKKQGKNDCIENIIKQFIAKYPNRSNEVLPKLSSRKNNEEISSIDSKNNYVPVKLIKKIKINDKARNCIVKFIDSQLLFRFRLLKPYTFIKISNITDTDWGTHYEMKKALSNYEILSYIRYLTFSSNFIAVWSNVVDSSVYKLRVFNNAGEFLWDYDVNNISDRSQMVAISISDTGLILYAVGDTAYLIGKDKKELVKWKCPKELVEEEKHLFSWNEVPGNDNDKILEFIEKKYGIGWVKNAKIEKCNDRKVINVFTDKKSLSIRLDLEEGLGYLEIDDGRSDVLFVNDENGKIFIDEFGEDGSISIKMEGKMIEPFNEIRALKISRDSKYIFIGCCSGDLFCLNLQNKVLWHHKISSQSLNKIISSNDGENLIIIDGYGYIYFIEKGKILTEYKHTKGNILSEYHNIKQQFLISCGKEFSIFDKSGTLLNQIFFNKDVNCFDVSEKLNLIAMSSSDGINIYSI